MLHIKNKAKKADASHHLDIQPEKKGREEQPPSYRKLKSNFFRSVSFRDSVFKRAGSDCDGEAVVCNCVLNSEHSKGQAKRKRANNANSEGVGFGCGPASDCLNRALNMECWPGQCPTLKETDTHCANSALQRNQKLQTEVFLTSDGRGWGLRAMEDCPAHTIIGEYVGEAVTVEEYNERLKALNAESDLYFASLSSEIILDARTMGNEIRFANHGCVPNCQLQKWIVLGEPRLALVAIKAISRGQELLYNYNFSLEEIQKLVAQKCCCGAPTCTGQLGGKTQSPDQEQQSLDARADRAVKVMEMKKPMLSTLQEVLALGEEGLDPNVVRGLHRLKRRATKAEVWRNKVRSTLRLDASGKSVGGKPEAKISLSELEDLLSDMPNDVLVSEEKDLRATIKRCMQIEEMLAEIFQSSAGIQVGAKRMDLESCVVSANNSECSEDTDTSSKVPSVNGECMSKSFGENSATQGPQEPYQGTLANGESTTPELEIQTVLLEMVAILETSEEGESGTEAYSNIHPLFCGEIHKEWFLKHLFIAPQLEQEQNLLHKNDWQAYADVLRTMMDLQLRVEQQVCKDAECKAKTGKPALALVQQALKGIEQLDNVVFQNTDRLREIVASVEEWAKEACAVFGLEMVEGTEQKPMRALEIELEGRMVWSYLREAWLQKYHPEKSAPSRRLKVLKADSNNESDMVEGYTPLVLKIVKDTSPKESRADPEKLNGMVETGAKGAENSRRRRASALFTDNFLYYDKHAGPPASARGTPKDRHTSEQMVTTPKCRAAKSRASEKWTALKPGAVSPPPALAKVPKKKKHHNLILKKTKKRKERPNPDAQQEVVEPVKKQYTHHKSFPVCQKFIPKHTLQKYRPLLKLDEEGKLGLLEKEVLLPELSLSHLGPLICLCRLPRNIAARLGAPHKLISCVVCGKAFHIDCLPKLSLKKVESFVCLFCLHNAGYPASCDYASLAQWRFQVQAFLRVEQLENLQKKARMLPVMAVDAAILLDKLVEQIRNWELRYDKLIMDMCCLEGPCSCAATRFSKPSETCTALTIPTKTNNNKEVTLLQTAFGLLSECLQLRVGFGKKAEVIIGSIWQLMVSHLKHTGEEIKTSEEDDSFAYSSLIPEIGRLRMLEDQSSRFQLFPRDAKWKVHIKDLQGFIKVGLEHDLPKCVLLQRAQNLYGQAQNLLFDAKRVLGCPTSQELLWIKECVQRLPVDLSGEYNIFCIASLLLSRSNEKTERPEGQYCVCQGADDGRLMICCDMCQEWFHSECIGVEADKAKMPQAKKKRTSLQEEEEFICLSCCLTVNRQYRFWWSSKHAPKRRLPGFEDVYPQHENDARQDLALHSHTLGLTQHHEGKNEVPYSYAYFPGEMACASEAEMDETLNLALQSPDQELALQSQMQMDPDMQTAQFFAGADSQFPMHQNIMPQWAGAYDQDQAHEWLKSSGYEAAYMPTTVFPYYVDPMTYTGGRVNPTAFPEVVSSAQSLSHHEAHAFGSSIPANTIDARQLAFLRMHDLQTAASPTLAPANFPVFFNNFEEQPTTNHINVANQQPNPLYQNLNWQHYNPPYDSSQYDMSQTWAHLFDRPWT